MEMARSWTSDHGPNALDELLDGIEGYEGLRITGGVVEAQTRFDAFGGPRNHDLLLDAETAAGPVVISIEGKADESFGQTISEYSASAEAKEAEGEKTNAPARLEGLLAALAGWSGSAVDEHPDLRYQLFSGLAGALAAAADSSASRALFCVHEFEGDVEPSKVRGNEQDFEGFLTAVFPSVPRAAADNGFPCGPAWVPGNPDRIRADIELWMGKMRTPLAP
jgi:hypothetical protein